MPDLTSITSSLSSVDPVVWWLAATALLATCFGVLITLLLARRGPRLEAFQAMAAEALQRNNEGFLTLAAERLRAQQEAGAVDLDGRHKAIEDLVGPLHAVVLRFQEENRTLERARTATFSFPQTFDGEQTAWACGCSGGARSLIRRLLFAQPTLRLDAEGVMSDAWVRTFAEPFSVLAE